MLTLRRYRPHDQAAVWHLHVSALEVTGAYVGGDSLDKDLEEIEAVYLERKGEFLVGLHGQTLVAMGALREVTGDTAEIKRMRVHPEYQRRGYGTQVLTRLERTAKRLGYKKLVLDTSTAQVAAASLYRSAGYTETGRERSAGFEFIYLERLLE